MKTGKVSLERSALILMLGAAALLILAQYFMALSQSKELVTEINQQFFQDLELSIKSSLPFHLATEDKSQIARIMDQLFDKNNVHYVEVISAHGETLYLKERSGVSLAANETLYESHFDVLDDRPLYQSTFETIPPQDQARIGAVHIKSLPPETLTFMKQKLVLLQASFLVIGLGVLWAINIVLRRHVQSIKNIIGSLSKPDRKVRLEKAAESRISEYGHLSRTLVDAFNSLDHQLYELEEATAREHEERKRAELAERLNRAYIALLGERVAEPARIISSLLQITNEASYSKGIPLEFRRQIDLCSRAASKLNQLVIEITNFSSAPKPLSWVDLNEFIHEKKSSLKSKFEGQTIACNICFINRIGKSGNSLIYTDRTALDRLVSLLVERAFDRDRNGPLILEFTTSGKNGGKEDLLIIAKVPESSVSLSREDEGAWYDAIILRLLAPDRLNGTIRLTATHPDNTIQIQIPSRQDTTSEQQHSKQDPVFDFVLVARSGVCLKEIENWCQEFSVHFHTMDSIQDVKVCVQPRLNLVIVESVPSDCSEPELLRCLRQHALSSAILLRLGNPSEECIDGYDGFLETPFTPDQIITVVNSLREAKKCMAMFSS